MEWLLLLKLPPKYHTFHKTCAAAAFQPLCPRSGHPQTECSIFSDSSALEKSLFLSIHEPSVLAHSITLWDRGSGRSCHSLGTEVAQWCSQGTGAAAAMDQQLVCKRAKCPEGAVGKDSHPAHALRRKEGRDHSCHSFCPSIIYPSLWETSLSTIEFLRLKSDFTHRPGRALLVPQHHPRFVCFLKWLILCPFPKRGSLDPALCLIVLFSKDVRQERKRSLLFSFLYIQGLPAWLPLFFQREKKQNSLLLFLNWHNSAVFFQCHRTSLMNTNTLSSQKDRGELVKYIIYKKWVVPFTNSVQGRNSSMASK